MFACRYPRHMPVRLGDVTAVLDQLYDPAWADDWDAVGLVCGDPEQQVRRILFAVDPAPVVVEEALSWGADLLVVHHPLLLKPVSSVAATSPKGRVLQNLMGSGRALFTAHTNADAPAYGVNESLARAIGLQNPQVIVPDRGDGVDKLVTFVPHDNAEAVRQAITEAGAARSRGSPRTGASRSSRAPKGPRSSPR
jgi:putative NIF3 family GTP cyclohydrolase 1 type 2